MADVERLDEGRHLHVALINIMTSKTTSVAQRTILGSVARQTMLEPKSLTRLAPLSL